MMGKFAKAYLPILLAASSGTAQQGPQTAQHSI